MITCKFSENPTIEHVAYGGADMEVRDDNSLLKAIVHQRDREAFTELHERHQKRAYNQAIRILRNRTLAEDAVQETMLSIWNAAETVLPTGNAVDWILRIVTNKSINIGVNQRQRAKREERIAMEQNKSQSAVVAGAEDNELIAVLRSHIDQLPVLESTLLACSYGASMSHREIAKLVGLSHPTVSNKIQLALERLRANLSKAGVAAVVPLLSAEKLFEAMTTDHECPPGMTDRLLNRIDGILTRAARPLSRREAKTRSVGSMLAVGAAIVAAVATAAWFTLTQPMATKATMPALPAEVKSATAAHVPFSRTWDFNSVDSFKDIHVTQGRWKWLSDGGTGGSGCIETDAGRCAVSIELSRMEDVSVIVSFDVNFSYEGFDTATNHSFKAREWIRCTYSGKGTRLDIVTHGEQRIDNLTIRETTLADKGQSNSANIDGEPAPVGSWRSVQFITDKSQR
jgi:RNA polymerase sigma-70 factor (ECF subfamily)